MSAAKVRRSPAGTMVPEGIAFAVTALRSTNVEREARAASLPPVYVGSRVQEILNRFVLAFEDQSRSRAWALTGPYGSGKSTLALLLDALVGGIGERRRDALGLVSATNPALAKRFEAESAGIGPDGFLAASVTARREPLPVTIARALLNACEREAKLRGELPKTVRTAVAVLRADDTPSSAAIIGAIEEMCRHAPVLLVIDEFGKNLEYLAGSAAGSTLNDDLFLLQELAEAGSGANGLPLYILTLQHLSFLDYAPRSQDAQRREWAKIQGRFEDITMLPDIGDALQLIGRSLDHTAVSPAGRKRIAAHGAAAAQAWSERGLDCMVTGDRELFASVYPLHPLTAVAAPLLAAQAGQYDRSLVGFLASDEPHTVKRFLSERHDNTATVQLPQLYDYFLASGRTSLLASATASRWIEIDTRIGDAHGLAKRDLELVKTIGLLNLIDTAGALRASEELITFAMTDPQRGDSGALRTQLREQLDSLIARGFLVYREFSDEFRVWHGSDIDIAARVEASRNSCDESTVLDVVRRHLPVAVAAGQHSQRTGILRHFVTDATIAGRARLDGPAIATGADGLLIFHLGDRDDGPAVDSPLPVAVGTTDAVDRVLAAGREVCALEEVRRDTGLDAVARREVAERLGQATAALAAVVVDAFRPTREGTRWRLITADRDAEGYKSKPLSARSIAGVVSEACELTYHATPRIRNEMLGRHQLTSQGAKARRELLGRMLTNPDSQYLGISGYGPDRAMYSGVLGYLGLHRSVSGTENGFQLSAPRKSDSAWPVWAALVTRLTEAHTQTSLGDLFEGVIAPPFGLKAGVAPVLILAALIVHREEVALFEEGTYQPRLTPDLVERMVKNPRRFTVKAVATSGGQRKRVIELLADQFVTTARSSTYSHNRNAGLVAVTQVLLDHIRGLSPYGRRTRRLSSEEIAVRSALFEAREPDGLVFTDLPIALGMEPIGPTARRNESAATEFVSRVTAVLHELGDVDAALRVEVTGQIARAFRVPNDIPNMRRDLAARTRGFADRLLEHRLRGLITLTLNDQLADDDWIDPIVMRIAGTSLNEWTDDDATNFPGHAREFSRALDRISHLYSSAHLDAGAEPFTAQLVTLTNPDGNEERALVHIPNGANRAARKLVETTLASAEKTLGPDGPRILLATLARQLLVGEETTAASKPEMSTTVEATQ